MLSCPAFVVSPNILGFLPIKLNFHLYISKHVRLYATVSTMIISSCRVDWYSKRAAPSRNRCQMRTLSCSSIASLDIDGHTMLPFRLPIVSQAQNTARTSTDSLYPHFHHYHYHVSPSPSLLINGSARCFTSSSAKRNLLYKACLS
jgi:hypothetical protein